MRIDPKSTDWREEVHIKFAAIGPMSQATSSYLTGSMPNLQPIGFQMVLRLVDEAYKTVLHVTLEIKYFARS